MRGPFCAEAFDKHRRGAPPSGHDLFSVQDQEIARLCLGENAKFGNPLLLTYDQKHPPISIFTFRYITTSQAYCEYLRLILGGRVHFIGGRDHREHDGTSQRALLSTVPNTTRCWQTRRGHGNRSLKHLFILRLGSDLARPPNGGLHRCLS